MIILYWFCFVNNQLSNIWFWFFHYNRWEYLFSYFKNKFCSFSGNALLVNVALADLLVSGLVVPASAVVILAGLRDYLAVCRFQWFIAVLCFLVTVLSQAAIAVENYFRLCCSQNAYQKLSRGKITLTLLTFWSICACVSGVQLTTDLSFDYCTRKYIGLIEYQATICVLLVFVPILITISCFLFAGLQMRR